MIALLLSIAGALASGFYFPDAGVVAAGRGGAFTAGADNQFAQYYNPAGLVRIDAPTLHLGGVSVRQDVSFSRLAEDGTLMEPAVNDPPFFPIPEIGFATPLVQDKLVLAVGFYSPVTSMYDYDREGPQRYTILEAQLWQGWVGPSLAWRPLSWLMVGAGVSYNFFHVGQGITVTTSGQDNPAHDVDVLVDVWDLNNVHGNAGVIVEPLEQVSIGVSVQPPGQFTASGAGSLDFSGHALEDTLHQSVWDDPDVTMGMRLPLVLRTGVAVRPVEALEVEVDWVYEAWSQLDEIKVTDVDVVVTSDFMEQPVQETFDLPATFRDSWSLRLGAEYDLGQVASFRLGGMYDRSAFHPTNVSVALMDTDKLQVGAGATVKLLGDRLWLDGVFSWVYYTPLEMRESAVPQINAWNEDDVMIVGDGDYSSTGLMVGLGLRYRFLKTEG